MKLSTQLCICVVVKRSLIMDAEIVTHYNNGKWIKLQIPGHIHYMEL
jgi:hypothetical protein